MTFPALDKAAKLESILVSAAENPAQAWTSAASILTPEDPDETHREVFASIAAHWPAEKGPMPAWFPSPEFAQNTHMAALMRELGLPDDRALHRWSIENRGVFWERTVNRLGIRFANPAQQVLSGQDPRDPVWFPGARLNIASSCFLADPQTPAVVFRERPGQPLRQWSYAELERLSNCVANGLSKLGLKPGDAVAIDMTMTAYAVAIYLGLVKAGCPVISIADSFTPDEIATRLRIGAARAIFTMDQVARGNKKLPMYEKVRAAQPPVCVVLPLERELALELAPGDWSWDQFLAGTSDHFEAIASEPDQVINILFSSGTTGDPKAIPWTQLTPIKAAADAHFHHDVHPGDLVAWPTNLGWMMGPWLIFATLINRGTIALFHDAPIGADFCTFIQDARVNVLGVVPSIVKSWRASRAIDGLDWSAIKCFSSTGECSSPDDMFYLMGRAGYRPVVEYCGGTEIGGGYITQSPLQPCIPSTFSTPALGMDIRLLDEAGQLADSGELYLVPPSIGLSQRLLNKDHFEVYYADVPVDPAGCNLRRHGDQLERLPNGYYRAQGRADDTMNLGGIKVSSAEIERAMLGLAGLLETAAIAVPPPDGGPSLLVIFAVTTAAAPTQEELLASMQAAIRGKLNPLFKIQQLKILESLPRTASGKVMRRVLRDRYLKG